MSFFDPKPPIVVNPVGGNQPAAPPPPGAPTDFYSKLLGDDPQLQATLASLASLGDAYGAGFGNQIQGLLEQYGAVPDQVPDALKPYITQTVRDLAGAATSGGVSTLAQLAQAAKAAHEHSISSLAARGLIHSGALGQHENEDLQNANIARANALSTLLGNVGQAQQGYLGQQQSLEQQRESAANDALNRLYSKIQGGIVAAPGASTGTGSTTPTPKVKPPPAAPTLPYRPRPRTVLANPTGGSARLNGGIFAIH